MRSLDSAQVATSASATGSAFEVLVPWSEVYPHRPWLSAVGFNLCVTRALQGDESALLLGGRSPSLGVYIWKTLCRTFWLGFQRNSGGRSKSEDRRLP